MNELKIIGKIETDFKQKFGIPRQSGLANSALGYITFENEYKDPKYIQGLEEYDYIWVIFGFSENKDGGKATVRPPRLGGKKRMGVFATRAPFRPNNIGLSLVKIESIKWDEIRGNVITVSGVDMLDKTPIYDIKPYLPYLESHPDARGGFGSQVYGKEELEISFPDKLLEQLPVEYHAPVFEILSQDPRAAYDKGKKREFKLEYAGYDICFCVENNVVFVRDVNKVN